MTLWAADALAAEMFAEEDEAETLAGMSVAG